ncbi:MAG: hypothetical protein CR955_01055 [Thiotrichales bacterium]|nr:MAG: hypothetical protein CR955_01055 [Thiotrichales bacterium]
MTILAVSSLLFSLILYRRICLIENTAKTTLHSAAQGYVGLEGKASLYEGEVVRGPHPELPPMLWVRNHIIESWAGFILSDDKGRCTIDPHNAEIITPTYHYNQHVYNAIYPNEKIYVLGQLHTLKKQRNDFEVNNLVLSKLAEWKRNHFNFLAYFDKNKDGKIDDGELVTAKHAASRMVDLALEEMYQKPATHVISNPDDGRPYLISSIHPDKLIGRYKRALVFHLGAWIILSIYVLAMQVY